ncbi:MAG: class I SAM-dependent methyltransferase [archaeon]
MKVIILSNMIKLDKLYFSENVENEYNFEYDKESKKRPSWLKFKDLPKKVQFVKILIDEEAFWYRRYFENYFFPLNNTKEDYENYYDEIAEDYEDMVPQNKKIAEFILDKLKDLNISKETEILELGAGTGLVSEHLVKKGYKNLVLIDISSKCLNVAKKKEVLSKCKFIKANLLSFKSKKKFRIIYNSMSLDYFNEYELDKILKLTKQNLKKGGVFISVDRHIYKEYEKNFKKLDSGWFNLKTKSGSFRYDYFIGLNS